MALTSAGRHLVEQVTDRRRRDVAAIAAAMAPEDRAEAVRALSSFARAAGELPVVDTFGWSEVGGIRSAVDD